VVRVWQLPVENLLRGGLGTLPLAPIGEVEAATLPTVVERMAARLADEATPAEAATLWSTSYLLRGLRYPAELATQLLRGVRNMRESTTYQAIIAEGRAEGIERMREALFVLGSKRFGEPDPATRAAISAMNDLDSLTRLVERVMDVETWADLLSAP